YVRKGPESQGISIIRNPYVARVLQGAGPQSTVTINVNGAFFFSMASVIDDRFEGGPISFRGSRPIQVGPYRGGSFHAQVLALLHEFGHVIDLLPQDHDDYEGRSRKNTQDVLYVCRAAVESKEAPRTFLASRRPLGSKAWWQEIHWRAVGAQRTQCGGLCTGVLCV